jgi:hypothetical protein
MKGWDLTYLVLSNMDIMPPDKIVNMSLNGLRRKVSTHPKNLTRHRMEKPLVALDLGH